MRSSKRLRQRLNYTDKGRLRRKVRMQLRKSFWKLKLYLKKSKKKYKLKNLQ